MKRFLCIVLCLMLAIPAALAETADTLPKRFVRQLSGGNGARGYIRVTASGVAEWLNMLLPFTAADIQVRAIGQKQGEMSESITDDDAWQIKFYAKDDAGKEAGTTWLYGDPNGVYFKSELLPETVLKADVKKIHLLYQLFKGEFAELFFAFDPMKLQIPGANGNASAYEALAEMLGIPADEWTKEWLPVLEKYFLHLDLWLTGYGESSIVGEDAGALTMSAAYTIPAADLKAEAKYVIGQMLYDNALQELLIPHVTMEQRITYLNPQMLYFYEACIDSLALTGDIKLSREMSALGEVVSTTIELPLPALPEKLTAPVGAAAKTMMALTYDDLLAGMDRMTLSQKGNERTITLAGGKRTITLSYTETAKDTGADLAGMLHITPAEGSTEQAVQAAYTLSHGHRIWQDEKYLDHDTVDFAFTLSPAGEEGQAEFQPVALSFTLDYRNNPHQQDSPVQVNLNVNAKLHDADVAVEAVMRITTQIVMEKLSTEGAQDASALTEEDKEKLLTTFVQNAANTMASLHGSVAESAEVPTAEPTSVPPMSE